MNPIPEPNRAHVPDTGPAPVPLASHIGALTGRQAREALRWLARDPDPAFVTAVRAAVMGQVAAAGLDDEQVPCCRPEPSWAENWFCRSCSSVMVGSRPADDVCGGCKAAKAASAA